jgi:hypothetical protein
MPAHLFRYDRFASTLLTLPYPLFRLELVARAVDVPENQRVGYRSRIKPAVAVLIFSASPARAWFVSANLHGGLEPLNGYLYKRVAIYLRDKLGTAS